MPIVPPKTVVLPNFHPNLGLKVQYQKRLDKMIRQMNRSLVYWLTATYRQNTPEIMAQDASPAAMLLRALNKRIAQWQKHFNDLAPTIAKDFADSVKTHSDDALKAKLKKVGMTVKFKMTAPMNDAYRAVIGEQVGLIKSIASAHLADVQGIVMRSVQNGRDLGYLAKELEERYSVTRGRAALIARDQNNKATATLSRVRQLEVAGDEAEAIWAHSIAGKTPRPSHVAANGKRYLVKKGMLIDGEWILPGEKINCRCTSRLIIKGFRDVE